MLSFTCSSLLLMIITATSAQHNTRANNTNASDLKRAIKATLLQRLLQSPANDYSSRDLNDHPVSIWNSGKYGDWDKIVGPNDDLPKRQSDTSGMFGTSRVLGRDFGGEAGNYKRSDIKRPSSHLIQLPCLANCPWDHDNQPRSLPEQTNTEEEGKDRRVVEDDEDPRVLQRIVDDEMPEITRRIVEEEIPEITRRIVEDEIPEITRRIVEDEMPEITRRIVEQLPELMKKRGLSGNSGEMAQWDGGQSSVFGTTRGVGKRLAPPKQLRSANSNQQAWDLSAIAEREAPAVKTLHNEDILEGKVYNQ